VETIFKLVELATKQLKLCPLFKLLAKQQFLPAKIYRPKIFELFLNRIPRRQSDYTNGLGFAVRLGLA